MTSTLNWTILLLFWVLSCSAALYERLDDLPKVTYDFVVVGGGVAGNVLANRLSENPRVTVLVLEAGGIASNLLESQVPFYFGSLSTPTGPLNWNYSTIPQPGLNGRVVSYPRGFALGGSSATNGMVYTRGSSDDYDRWARVTGDEGWAWKNLRKYIPRSERFEQPWDHHDTTGKYNPAVHGTNGLNTVTLNGQYGALNSVMKAAVDESSEFPFNVDYNSGNPLGLGYAQLNIKNGTRSSSATSYLAPEFLSRPNLHVLIHARVTQILKTGEQQGIPAFRGVKVTQDGGVTSKEVVARKEVILSAGTVNTPPLLLHSGIGNSTFLTSLGIEPILNLPSVGHNLSDHSFVANSWLVNSNSTYEAFTRDPAILPELEKQWKEKRTGPLANAGVDWVGFFRLPGSSAIFEKYEDPSAGPKTPHYELMIVNGGFGSPPATGGYLTLAIVDVQPTSRGYVSIDSADPFAAPLIHPNLIDTEYDLYILREALFAARRLVSAPAFKDYVVSDVNSVPPTELDEHIRNSASHGFHATGTAGMSPRGAEWGVVNPDLKVKGADGLRIVDASVFPYIISAHTMTGTYLLAERASDLIKEQYRL